MSRLEDERRRHTKLARNRIKRTARELLARSITERTWQAQLVELAARMRWRNYHTRDSRRSVEGWPDLVLVSPPRTVYLECKTETGTATPEQLGWFEALGACGFVAAVVRPRDFPLVMQLLLEPQTVAVVRDTRGEPVLARREKTIHPRGEQTL